MAKIDVSQLNESELQSLKKQLEKIETEKKDKRHKKKDAFERKKDRFLTETIRKVGKLQQQLITFKEATFQNADHLRELLNQIDDADNGFLNFTLTHSDESIRIEVKSDTIPVYDETFESGINKIRQWLEGKIKNSDKTLALLVEKALGKDYKGDYKPAKLLELLSLENKINENLFSEGCAIIRDSFKKGESKRYIRFKVKGENNAWQNITLQFSAL